jgi:hypothetical protein
MTNAAKKHRRHVGGATRDSSAVRRAPLALATPPAPSFDSGRLARLAGHMLEAAAGVEGAARRVRDYRHKLRRSGHADVVQLAAALHVDGGRLLRILSRARPDVREAAAAAAIAFAKTAAEHDVRSASALAMLVRATLEGAVADAALERLLTGAPSAADAKLASALSASSRIGVLSALAVEEKARCAPEDDVDPRSGLPRSLPESSHVFAVELQRRAEAKRQAALQAPVDAPAGEDGREPTHGANGAPQGTSREGEPTS